MKVGQWLVEEKGQVPLKELAKRLDVSVRTLHNWRAEAQKASPSRLGRPRYTEAMHRQALWKVGRELILQGYPGWRAVAEALGDKVPVRLVQLYVQQFKLRHRKRQRHLRAKHRVCIKVKSKNIIWTQDGTHLGRLKKKSIEAQVIKDRGSQKIIGISVGPSAVADTIIGELEKIKCHRGLPLVWSTDNGSIYLDKKVSAYLEKEKVIHLKSLPQTPEHNGAAEIGMRELKSGSYLGKGRTLKEVSEAREELVRIAKRLNENRLRASLGFETASVVDRKLAQVYTKDVRARFYDECMDAIGRATQVGVTDRRKRLAVRNVVLEKLQKYGFIELKRGDR